jgi:hypothetical protein
MPGTPSRDADTAEPEAKRIRLTVQGGSAGGSSSQPALGLEPRDADGTPTAATEHDLTNAPGKEREREPVLGGDIANITSEGAAMEVDGEEQANGKANGELTRTVKGLVVPCCAVY